jgi:hypothetical protein
MTDMDFLASCKEDLRMDGDEYDDIILRKRDAAAQFLAGAGCAVDIDRPLCYEAIVRWVGLAIDSPEISPASDHGLIAIIEQMRMTDNE